MASNPYQDDYLRSLIEGSLNQGAPAPAPAPMPFEQPAPIVDPAQNLGPTGQQFMDVGADVLAENAEAPPPPEAPELVTSDEAPTEAPPPQSLSDKFREAGQNTQDAMNDFSEAGDRQIESLRDQKAAYGQQAAIDSSIENQRRRDEEELAGAEAEGHKKAQVRFQDEIGRLNGREEQIANTPLDSDRLWHSKNSGQKVAGLFAAMLSGFMSPHTGGRNLFLEQFEKQIDRDLQMQRDDRRTQLQQIKGEKGDARETLNGELQQNLLDLSTKKAKFGAGLNKLYDLKAGAMGTANEANIDYQIGQLEQKHAGLEVQKAQAQEKYLGALMNDEAKLAQEALLAQQAASSRGSGGGGEAADTFGGGQKTHVYRRSSPFQPVDGSGYKPSEGQYVMTGVSFDVQSPDGQTYSYNRAEVAEAGEGKKKLQNQISDRNTMRGAANGFITTAMRMKDKYGYTGAVTEEALQKAGIPNEEYMALRQATQGLVDSYRVGGGYGASFTEGEAKLLNESVFGSDPNKMLASTNLGALANVVQRAADMRDDHLRGRVATLLGPEVNPSSIKFTTQERMLTRSMDAGNRAKDEASKPKSAKELTLIGSIKDKSPGATKDAKAAIDSMLGEAKNLYTDGKDTDEGEGTRVKTAYSEKEVQGIPKQLAKVYNSTPNSMVKNKAKNALKDFQKLRRKRMITDDTWKEGEMLIKEARELSELLGKRIRTDGPKKRKKTGSGGGSVK